MGSYVSKDNMTSIMQGIASKFNEYDGAYVYKGSVTFANLPASPTAAMTGYVYNLSEEFTTDSRFIEGSGKKYAAGTDVVVANIGTAQSPNMKFDVHASFVDVDGINGRIDDAVNSFADEFDADHTGGYAIGDVVIHEDALYIFTSAHTEGDPWDATEVTATTIEALINSAEPDSLSEQEVADLIALL